MRARYKAVTAGLLVVAGLVGGGVATANAASGWQPTSSMSTARRAHGAALLNDGRVLVVSGTSSSGDVPGAELWSPTAGTWSPAAPPLVPRHYATTTKLPDGRVLVAGGKATSGVTTHAELYDPIANTWTATGPMSEPRSLHAAVLLRNGRVLVTGGADAAQNASSTAELYDPATGTWSPAGSFGESRASHQLTLLADGRVLLAGGQANSPSLAFRSSSAIYDPATNGWTATGPMATSRAQVKGGLLADGTVLTAGGVNTGGFVSGAERFDPLTGTWSAAGSPGIQGNISYGISLRGGTFLLTTDGSKTTPIYNGSLLPATAGWSSHHQASTARSLSTLTLLQDGRVLNAGGSSFSSAEIFTPPPVRGSSGGDFGEVYLGAQREQDVTLSDDGGSPLSVDGIALAGTDRTAFAIVRDDCTGETLQPAESCVVRVRFSPLGAGAHSAELTVDDNAETSAAVVLSGEGRTKPPPAEPGPLPDPARPIVPVPPIRPDPSIPVSCTRPYVALVGITATGGSKAPRARLAGLATPSLAGRTVTVLRGTRKVGSARVGADGRIAVSVPAPKASRARDVARYRLSIPGSVRSAALKATRRVGSARKATLSDGRVRITGWVAGVRRPTTLQVRSAPVCGPKVRGVRVRTDRRGRFRVTLSAPPSGVPAVVHRVWLQKRSVTLPIVVGAKA